MTLNSVIALILRYFTKFDSFGDYITMVVDRLIRAGAEYPLLLIFWPKLTHTVVAQSLCDS